MSFQTGLSGLNASSQSLDVIGNNIANANTVGMKSSRAEFADLVAASLGAGGSSNSAGIGTAVGAISQSFTQGNISVTGNALDVAINGGGFFQLTKTDGSTAYTRDGQFKLDKDGNIVTNTGAFLMGYPTDITGNASSFSTQKLSIPTGSPIPAKVTGTIKAEFNLDARAATAIATTAPAQYGTSITAYDSQGVEIPVSLYFVKTAADTWNVYNNLAYATAAISGAPINDLNDATNPANGSTIDLTIVSDQTTVPPTAGSLFQMTFGPSGTITAPATAQTIKLKSSNPNIGTSGYFDAQLDLTKATQFGVNFAISDLSQDGYTSGEFTGLSIDGKGVITTRYSNGQTKKDGGMLALADFRNTQGLTPTGSGEYLETFKSGPAVMGQPTVGRYGAMRSGSLEESNVDLTAELVNMMTAQRNYQANAQTIKTQDQIMSTLVNLR
ncbi:MAG: flagellar hook protein FlgE [Rhodoferax sp.]|nr:flagellar hook protein FlgE [Rhodoferax sp.]